MLSCGSEVGALDETVSVVHLIDFIGDNYIQHTLSRRGFGVLGF